MIEEIKKEDNGTVIRLAPEHKIIIDLVEEGSRVMDLGCGKGDLLKALKDAKKVRAEGIDLDEEAIQACVAKGLFNVHHGNLDEGLADYADKSCDYVILTNTIQVLHRPMFLIKEMARVGKKCIISLPNFGHWWVRSQLMLKGRMPKSPRLPYEWYDTPNIHLATVIDFRDFCEAANLQILKEICLRTTGEGKCRIVHFKPNFFA
ncbi:MAG TPA: methionine biosynthesis protein MetW, partial [Armatimonadota bacterium]|nr:methionine biosynthesis protein MetW [Armatimonadota bacterium]